MGTDYATIKNHRGLAADWTGNNPTLAAGEIGIETDTNKMKIGDGTTAWTSLLYFPTVTNNLTATELSATGVETTTLTATTIIATNLTATSISATTVCATNITFGTYAASAAAVVVGYITITDAGGTSRKLAVI